MEKKILLRVRDEEKTVIVRAFINNIDFNPKFNFLSSSKPIDKTPIQLPIYLRIEIEIQLYLCIDQYEIPLTYKVYLQREDNHDPILDVFGDNDYKINYIKHLESDQYFNDFKDHPASDFIISFMILINSTDISNNSLEKEFWNINPENNLIKFNSYKDFDYSINKEEIYDDKPIRAYHKRINKHNIFSILPADYKTYFIKDDGIFKHKTQPDLGNLEIWKAQEVLKVGNFDEINEIFNNEEKFKELRKLYFKRKEDEYKKKKHKSSFDIRDTVDWSNYNDDLDKDQQDPDFWNQF